MTGGGSGTTMAQSVGHAPIASHRRFVTAVAMLAASPLKKLLRPWMS